jgi:hypothetical protein
LSKALEESSATWPAEEFAQARRLEGQHAEVVMDLSTDTFLVVVRDLVE